ncbi:putative snf2 family helicase [Diaporthe ampelina]|uniref:Putative snf2 family helicase n=1 Tax=Diaporthe ampelina TaxID=1214573 RepID=A0A0G2HZN6_9PEZI|nr:putative snf2 family helicase [Diaporthe ampelina]
MAGVKGDDPFDWEIDRVVQELCTADRSWIPTPRAKLPDPEILAQKLREGEYDGETLLATPEDDLWKDLGITKAKFKVNLRHAIGQFVSRSHKYKKYLASVKDHDADSDFDTIEAPHQAFTPMSDTSVPAQAPAPAQQPVETVENGVKPPRTDEHPDEPPKKKAKRLEVSALTTTSRPSNVDQPFSVAPLPTELDTMEHSFKEAGRVPLRREMAEAPPEDFEMDLNQCESNPGAYWGNGRLPRSGIIEASTSADNNVNFGWARPRPIGRAKKKYVADKLKGYLRRQKQEVDDKSNDILPLYGQSDDEEYGSELEKLIEEEEMEEAEADQALGLEASEVDDILKQMVDGCATYWHEQQLPKEKHKAYKMWDDARRHGTRGSTVKAMSEELWKGRTRLEKTLAEMKDNQYKTESELRGMSDFLQPDIDKIEHIRWLIGVLNSPHPPERVVRPEAPSQRKPKTKRTDDIDLWSEGELEEEMYNFIVNDDPYEEADPHEQPAEPQDDDVEHSVPSVSLNPTQSFASGTSDDIEMHDLTQIDDSPFRSRNYTLIDLVTPTKPKRKPATPRESAKRTAHGASPTTEKFPLSDPKAICNKGSLHWEERRDVERLIVTNLCNQHGGRIRDIFDNVILMQSEDHPIELFWKDYIEYACERAELSGDLVNGSREKNRYDTAAVLTRQFGIYLNKYSGSTFVKLTMTDPGLMDRLLAGRAHLPEFFALLTTLAPYFGFTQEKDELVSNDDDYASESPDAKRAAEPKQAPAGSSQNVRDKEKRRQREQQQRRLQLRQQVQGSLLPSEKSRLIINESKLEGQNLVYVHEHIAGRIKNHQIDGVRFMWDQILSDAKQGCLLAHAMGLGKTMQVVTLLTAIQEAANSEDPKVSCQIPDELKVSKTLILCPAGLLQNWVEELLKWAPIGLLGNLLWVSADLSEEERSDMVQEWAEDGGVLVIGYTMLTQIAKRPNLRTLILESPSIVVGDEAHQLKNEKSQRSGIASRFRTQTRIALTGSPLANNVDEYYAMIQWVAPGFLGAKKWFNSEYTSPISKGLYEDSSRTEKKKAKIRLAALTKLVAPKVHRRTVATLKDSLQPKTEYIVYLDLRSVQRAVYLSHLAVVNGAGGEQAPLVWALIRTLGLLLAHPLILERVLKQKLQESGQPGSNKVASKEGEEDQFAPLPYQVVSTTLDALTRQQGYADLNSSFKMLALFKIIEETTKLGENLLVFTQSIPSLDFIEKICRQKKLLYKRLDGKTEVNKRQAQVKAFNEGTGQVYLISTTAGGVGLNIYGASRVVIFDFQHSPVHEQQAIGRAYRIGQTKPVVVYWLICDGTFEKTLHNQQVFKNQLASSVVDKKNPLPKATSLRQYFTEPQQVEHQNTAAYLGQDTVLDTLLLSDEIREGISSISTTETFEEEDTHKLEAEEIALADQLVQQQIFRRNNPAEENPFGIPPQPSEHMVPTIPVPYGLPVFMGSHQHNLHQPGVVVPDEFGQIQYQHHNVPTLVERINKHIKGGGLVRTSTWTKLKALVWGRQDRVDAILDGRVSPQDLATADDPKAGLENLLDGRSSVPQSQDNRRMKDPDHSQRSLQRSMTEDDQRSGANSHKESDLAALRKVWANRQSKPQDNPKQPKVKAEQAEQADEADQRRQTMPPGGYGKTISDPFVIDDD